MLFPEKSFRRPPSQGQGLGYRQELLGGIFSGRDVLPPFIFFLLLGLFLSTCPQALAFTSFRIGTGGSTGVYYPVGKLIARGLTASASEDDSALRGHIGIAQNSAGSIENIRAVIAGELEAGMAQADTAAQAFNRQGDFAGVADATNVRAIAGLYPEKFHLVVRKDAGIHTFEDLKGKRISVDEIGSGTRDIMNIVLQAHGLTENDLLPLYLKPAFIEDKIKSGGLQGFVIAAGAPNAAVTQLFDIGITLVPIARPIAVGINLRYKYLTPGKIDKDIYRDVPETPTLEVYALLIVDGRMSDDMAYAVTKSLFSPETLRLLQEGHPLGKAITLESAQQGVSIPLHPGAERFYRERRMVQ